MQSGATETNVHIAMPVSHLVHPGATLAGLYNPDLMPPDLRHAHADLDRAVDKLYRRKTFDHDRERVEHLFALYERTVAPLMAAGQKRHRRG